MQWSTSETKGGVGWKTKQPLLFDVWLTRPSSTLRLPKKETWSETSCRVNTRFISLCVCVYCVRAFEMIRAGPADWLWPAAGLETHVSTSSSTGRWNDADAAEEKHGVRGCLYTAATVCSSFTILQTPRVTFQYINCMIHTWGSKYMSVYLHSYRASYPSGFHTHTHTEKVMTPLVTRWSAGGSYRVKGHQLLFTFTVYHVWFMNFFTLDIQLFFNLMNWIWSSILYLHSEVCYISVLQTVYFYVT